MFTLPDLKYNCDHLVPHVDKETMEMHHDYHHRSYVNNLNSNVEKISCKEESLTDLLTKTIHDPSIEEPVRTGIRNHGGGHYNHSLFWLLMSKDSDDEDMCSDLRRMISRDFGSLENFKSKFTASALAVFGSGWAWLVYNSRNEVLEVVKTLNQDVPFSECNDKIPVLGLDVWEHAYYLQYKHARGKYIEAWWNVVNWKNVTYFFEEYAKKKKLVHVNPDGTVD